VAEAEGPTGLIEDSLRLGTAIGERAAQPPAGAAIQREQDAAQGVSGRFGGVGGQQPVTPYERAASQAVICQTFPTPFL
jgi:hypothetical protein